MDNGWRILNLDGSYLNSDLLQQISEKTKLVICSIEEHCMATEAEAWEDQEKIWSVAHVRDKGKDHLEASGELPPAYAEIASKYLDLHKKRPADYLFEIPSEVAQSVTGFKMD
jgi:hypothetical protein